MAPERPTPQDSPKPVAEAIAAIADRLRTVRRPRLFARAGLCRELGETNEDSA